MTKNHKLVIIFITLLFHFIENSNLIKDVCHYFEQLKNSCMSLKENNANITCDHCNLFSIYNFNY